MSVHACRIAHKKRLPWHVPFPTLFSVQRRAACSPLLVHRTSWSSVLESAPLSQVTLSKGLASLDKKSRDPCLCQSRGSAFNGYKHNKCGRSGWCEEQEGTVSLSHGKKGRIPRVWPEASVDNVDTRACLECGLTSLAKDMRCHSRN